MELLASGIRKWVMFVMLKALITSVDSLHHFGLLLKSLLVTRFVFIPVSALLSISQSWFPVSDTFEILFTSGIIFMCFSHTLGLFVTFLHCFFADMLYLEIFFYPEIHYETITSSLKKLSGLQTQT